MKLEDEKFISAVLQNSELQREFNSRTILANQSFEVGSLVKVRSSEDLRGLVQTTYEDWLYHKSKWEGQVGVLLSSDIFLSGKAQVLLEDEVVYISKIFLETVRI